MPAVVSRKSFRGGLGQGGTVNYGSRDIRGPSRGRWLAAYPLSTYLLSTIDTDGAGTGARAPVVARLASVAAERCPLGEWWLLARGEPPAFTRSCWTAANGDDARVSTARRRRRGCDQGTRSRANRPGARHDWLGGRQP